jgi:ubiquinone/menaquinone biosynthesis C-methylase UbiE
MSANATASQPTPHGGVCPWWLGYFLVSPLRRLIENPERLLGPHARPGMKILEVGCGMGYFTLPLARMVGSEGRVLCVDVQPRMLAALGRRARRAGLADRIEARPCGAASLGLGDRASAFDLAVLIHVLHELPDTASALAEIRSALKPEGHLLLIEPPGHVSREGFDAQLEVARAAGLTVENRQPLKRYQAALLAVAPTTR